MDKRTLPGIRSTLGNIYTYLLDLAEKLDAIEAKMDRVEAKPDELVELEKTRHLPAGLVS
jgi:hypothetical protein